MFIFVLDNNDNNKIIMLLDIFRNYSECKKSKVKKKSYSSEKKLQKEREGEEH